MANEDEDISSVLDDPVVRLLLRGEAETLHEAEEKYLDAAIPEILNLLAGPSSNRELVEHPLLNLVLTHGNLGGHPGSVQHLREHAIYLRASPIPANLNA